MGRHGGGPEQITIDGRAANEAAIKSDKEAHGTSIEMRKIKELNNLVKITPCGRTLALDRYAQSVVIGSPPPIFSPRSYGEFRASEK